MKHMLCKNVKPDRNATFLSETLLRAALQVESLHTLGGPMKGCVAASYKDEVSVYSTLAVTPSAQPKTTWQPHNGFVSQLHRSSYGIDLFTAAVDGSIHRLPVPLLWCLPRCQGCRRSVTWSATRFSFHTSLMKAVSISEQGAILLKKANPKPYNP